MAGPYYTNIATNQQDGFNFPGAPSSIAAPPSGTGFNDPVLELGNVDITIATYTMLGTEAAAELINVVLLQQGQFVIPQVSWVVSNAAGTTAAVQIGDTDPAGASATRYSAALDIHVSGTQQPFTGGAASLAPYAVSAACWLQATLSTLSVPVAGKVIVFWVAIASNR